MKIIASTALALASLASLTLAERGFKPSELEGGDKNKTARIKTNANFGNTAKIDLCPSGDCDNGQKVTMSLVRMQEVDDEGSIVQRAPNFNALNASWTAFEAMDINGTEAYTSSFVTSFTVQDKGNKGATEETSFNLTATIYSANGTAMNGNQTIDVPAGALKFSVAVSGWTFKDPANRLQFGVQLLARGKDKMERNGANKKPKRGNHTDIDRVDMGEGMFMDAPTLAVLDGVEAAINSTVESQDKKTMLVWIFPSFQSSLYYDPVMGSEDESASTTETPAPPTTKPTTSSAMAAAMTSVLAAGFVAVATAMVM